MYFGCIRISLGNVVSSQLRRQWIRSKIKGKEKNTGTRNVSLKKNNKKKTNKQKHDYIVITACKIPYCTHDHANIERLFIYLHSKISCPLNALSYYNQGIYSIALQLQVHCSKIFDLIVILTADTYPFTHTVTEYLHTAEAYVYPNVT